MKVVVRKGGGQQPNPTNINPTGGTMNKLRGLSLAAVAAICIIGGFVLFNKGESTKMWDSIKKGERMEYFSYVLFAAGVASGIGAAKSFMNRQD